MLRNLFILNYISFKNKNKKLISFNYFGVKKAGTQHLITASLNCLLVTMTANAHKRATVYR